MAEKKAAKRPQDHSGAQARGGGGGWFENLPDLKKDLLCAGFMLLVVYVLFWPIISSNLDLASPSGDFTATHNWVNAMDTIRAREGIDPLWMPYLYGGMPVASSLLFPRAVNYLEAGLTWIANIIFAASDAHYFLLHVFLSGLFMYMLARSLKLPHLGALLAGCVYMLNPYAIGLGESFHWSKLAVFSYIPLLFLLARRLMERKDLLSFGLLAATMGTMFLNRHPQIAFYGMLLVAAYFLYEFIADIRTEPLKYAGMGALLVAALLLGMAIYSYEMLPTKEYAEYSVRGGGGETAGGGASYEWATNWSLHPLEAMTYIVPSWFGFGADVSLDWKGQFIESFPGYWGWMPSTDNPPYIGIVPLILAVFALVYRRNRMTWFLAVFSVVVLFLSFGRYLPVLYDLFYHFFPYFNKFRAPSLILFLIPLTVGLLGVYGLSWIIDAGRAGGRPGPAGSPAPDRAILRWMIAMAGVFILAFAGKDALFGMFPPSAFTKEAEPYNAQTMVVIRQIRFELLWRDILKVTGMAAVLFALAWAYLRRTIGATTMSLGMVALLVADLAIIDGEFINPRPKTDLEAALRPDATMQFLRSDTTVYRVISLEPGLHRDNTMMNYAIASITGYSPAKLKIYQEFYDSALIHPTDQVMPLNMNAVAMMNGKYVISPSPLPPMEFHQRNYDPVKKLFVYQYSKALQRAWFADTAVMAVSKSDMYAMMNSPSWKPNVTAILNEPVPPELTVPDSSWVRVASWGAHTIVMKAYTSSPGLLVLSEVYYPAGWTATVDGAETRIYRTDAVLRSVVVPAGEHEVKFVFDPDSFRTGSAVTTAGWAITLLLVAIGAFREPKIRGLLGKKSASG